MNTKFSNLIALAADNIFDKLLEEAKGAAVSDHWEDSLKKTRTDTMLEILQELYQKVEITQEDTDEGNFSARLWYNGKGMLPPNIEIYRVPSQADAIRALYAAAWLAFSGEKNDDE